MDSLLSWLWTVPTWALLVFGFGFVIFWHELGHFLAAKWAGIKVEQFAVGFGQAVVSYRKGLGTRFGSTQADYHRRIKEHVAKTDPSGLRMHEGEETVAPGVERRAAAALGISETEYRWNWIPLGGYVKMLGQDDLKPLAHSEDDRAYNRKSIGKRMVVVSAGVIMNVILAAIGFMVVFLAGFERAPAVVGSVMPGSPAQRVGIEVGDRILRLDGDYQADFAKLTLSTALADPTRPVPIEFQKPDG
ncbi:MAG TPA: site-2 protease family protein, partial [Tepidisphaeraceae bacterium]|nr:site-2 protease family protein [Tepidisphaeraceae bacterium]